MSSPVMNYSRNVSAPASDASLDSAEAYGSSIHVKTLRLPKRTSVTLRTWLSGRGLR